MPKGTGMPAFGFPIETELEVEYIEGFWHDTCFPVSGSLQFSVGLGSEIPNLGSPTQVSFTSFPVRVKILKPVYIDCSPTGYTMPADAQAPFHGKALSILNENRDEGDGTWLFEVGYDPGGGIMGQFTDLDAEKGAVKFPFPDGDGEYEVWQLLTLYQASPLEVFQDLQNAPARTLFFILAKWR